MDRADGLVLQVRDMDAQRTDFDRFAYYVENVLAQYRGAPYALLWVIFGFLTAFFGVAWYVVLNYVKTTSLQPLNGKVAEDDEHDDWAFHETGWEIIMAGADNCSSLRRLHEGGFFSPSPLRQLLSKTVEGAVEDSIGYKSLHDSLWWALQLMGAAGVDDSIPDILLLRFIYFACLMSGLVIFAILVGFVTDSVMSFMASLSEGRTKVVERGHTLLLGTNEATERVVTQLSLLRRQHLVVNETWARTLLPWRRTLPSSPVDAANIVVMTGSMTKPELNERLRQALASKGISPERTAVGKHVIARVGDPTSIQDLARVSADTAGTIIVMMSERDEAEFEESDGRIVNGATLRTVLALRHVLLTSSNEAAADNVVVQLMRPANHLGAASWQDKHGRQIVRATDLNFMVNGLMFSCAAQPGLSTVLMQLLDCAGAAFRRRKSQEFCGGVVGLTLHEASKRLDQGTVVGLTNSVLEDELETGYGIASDPERVIRQDELVIFISETASPDRCYCTEVAFAENTKRAEALPATPYDASTDEPTHTLICGWRPVWTDEAARLEARIGQLTKKMAAGSSIVFANAVPVDLFTTLIQEALGLSPSTATAAALTTSVSLPGRTTLWRTSGGVTLEHVPGDAADPPLMRALMSSRAFAVAIVLGSQARASGAELSPQARDTRILNILMLMRHLHEKSAFADTHLHVISENNIDETSMLALSPRDLSAAAESKKVSENDFVNTQAIFARTLVLSAAYPLIFPSIVDLFEEGDGAFIKLLHATSFLPAYRRVRWGVVQRRVALGRTDRREGSGGGAPKKYICFGAIVKSKLLLCLGNAEKVTFGPEDRLCCFFRKKSEIIGRLQGTGGPTKSLV